MGVLYAPGLFILKYFIYYKETCVMGKFAVRKTNTGFKFDLVAGNGETIATSEVYAAEASCLNGIASVVKCSAAAEFGRSQSYSLQHAATDSPNGSGFGNKRFQRGTDYVNVGFCA